MRRNPALTVEQIAARLVVDCATGRCFWKDATKHHRRLEGVEAGCEKRTSKGDAYWVIKLNGTPYKRSQIVVAVATGRWPEEMVDHKNGDKLDDRAENLRHATVTQNNQNHQRRAKRAATPMGVRELPSGRFQARVCGRAYGTFDTKESARSAHLEKRKELFGDYA